MKMSGSLAEFLREAREKSGYTQHEVSEALGYSTAQFISNWERGLSYPPLAALKTLSKLYKVNADQLFERIVEMSIEQTKTNLHKEYKRLKKG